MDALDKVRGVLMGVMLGGELEIREALLASFSIVLIIGVLGQTTGHDTVEHQGRIQYVGEPLTQGPWRFVAGQIKASIWKFQVAPG